MQIKWMHNRQGFTLIEMLLATFLFSLMVLSVSGIYIAFNNSQIRTNSGQQLLNDTQYALEVMTQEIRNSTIINYPGSGIDCNTLINTATDPIDNLFNDCLILEREDGQTVAFTTHYDSGKTNPTDNTRLYYLFLTCNDDYSNCVDVSLASTASIMLLSPDINNIRLNELKFDISPDTNPYLSGGPNQQPRVTINMWASYISLNEVKQIDYFFQTTISSRTYKR